eukprot:TRINITY_DN3020_c1_g1_i1.p1 TRINITY_DN3020_c1_g1~~TRINITY_DN3020_c1_g1_i1.p1  ORF type:complete len:173 (-),score=20.70 TRINITY_DN3020_c1_g1_i1:306-824(-)
MSTPTPGQPSAPASPMRGAGGGSRPPPLRARRNRIPVGTTGAPPPAWSPPSDAPVTRSPVGSGGPNVMPTSSPLGHAYRGRQVQTDMAARRRREGEAAHALPDLGTTDGAPTANLVHRRLVPPPAPLLQYLPPPSATTTTTATTTPTSPPTRSPAAPTTATANSGDGPCPRE